MPDLLPIEIFQRHFSATPQKEIVAPGRINLIGEHIDYLDGFVMPAAIDRSITMTVAANGSDSVRVWTPFLRDRNFVRFSIHDLQPIDGEDSWLNYMTGVVEMLRREGITPRGFDAVITSDLPIGAGLSSSAALETATALAVEAITGTSLDPVRRAELCQKAEHEFANVPCGIMDQMAVGLGHENCALMIDCRDQSYSPVPVPGEIAIIVTDTGVSHALGDGEYRNRRESCAEALSLLGESSWRDVSLSDVESRHDHLGDVLFRRARHVVTEMTRVPAMRDSLAANNLSQVASIMKSGHESLRDDFEVSCGELDLLVEAAYEFGTARGLVGARMTGGGFGGSTVTLVRESEATKLQEHLEASFEKTFSRKPNCFITRPAAGAKTRNFAEAEKPNQPLTR